MKLRRLAIERLPGIDRPFEIESLTDGLTVVWGPNGIGKSRLCAAVRTLLWPQADDTGGAMVARADFEHERERWQVRREHTRHGWQRDGLDADPPWLPATHLDACFFLGLRDLLDEEDRAGRDLAAEIRRQMSGGFDLAEVAKRFDAMVGPRVGQNERKSVEAAEREIRRALREQAEVEASERQLESLVARAAEAERAAPRGAYFEMAISLQAQKREAALCRRVLAELPDALERLDGRELERLDKLDETLARRREERAAARRALIAAKEEDAATGLESPLDPARLAAFGERAERLVELEREVRDARAAERAAHAALAERRRSLGAHADCGGEGADLPATPAIEDDFDLFAFLRESQNATREVQVVEERLRYLASKSFAEEDLRRLEAIRRAVEPLRAWLRAPDPGLRASVGSPGARWALLGVSLGAALGAVAGLLATSGSADGSVGLRGALLVVLGAALGVAGSLGVGALGARRTGRAAASPDWRSVARAQFPDAIEPPQAWVTEAVERRLRELEDELADLEAREIRSRDRAVERGPLEQSLKDLEARRAQLDARRVELAGRLGLDRLLGDAEIVDVVRGLEDARRAEVEWRRTQARAADLETSRDSALLEIADFVATLGEDRPSDASSARAAVQALARRDRTLGEARAEQRRQATTRDRLDAEIEALEADRGEIFRSAGVEPGDRVALAQRLDEWPRFRSATEKLAQLSSVIEHGESELESAGEGGLVERDPADLVEALAALKRSAEERSELEQRIAVIRNEASRARAGHVLEDAIAARQAALSALADRRNEALLAKAGASLIDSVRREYEKEQMPRVLERTRRRFATFTHDTYDVRVAADDEGSFVAIDRRSGEGLRPDQLSDGTRAQLILAARLAFAEEVERGADLPLFLDEAMDHSDPERFHAIARSLARMVADEGRQIFYLSNDPTDFERFEQAFAAESCSAPRMLDLARVRGRAARVTGVDALRVAPLPAVKAPVDDDPARYGDELGVPVLDPALDPGRQHLYYLLRDDLELLHAFLEARIESVGQCRHHFERDSEFARSIARRHELAASLPSRIDLLETFCRAWREGRGRPVDRAVLEESSVVSERYLDGLAEIAAEGQGEAARLMQALVDRDDPRVQGFRRRSAEKLEQYLIDEGYLDERPKLSESELVERAVATPAATQLGAKQAAELVHLWHSLVDRSKSRA